MEVLEKLLGDRTTLVLGSAIMVFEEVCLGVHAAVAVVPPYLTARVDLPG